MRGLEAAMIDRCNGSIQVCEAFTSLTAAQMDMYYQDVEFRTMKFSNSIILPAGVAFKDRQNANTYNNIQQVKKAENGSLITVQVSACKLFYNNDIKSSPS